MNTELGVTRQVSKKGKHHATKRESSDSWAAESMERIRSELPDIPGHSSRVILALDRPIPKCWVFMRKTRINQRNCIV